MNVIYIAGPYRSDTEWGLEKNIRHAEDAAVKLWKEGFAVICPHKNTAHFGGICDDKVWIKGDIEIMTRCDAVYILKGWEKSFGATEEHRIALELDMDLMYET